MTRKNSPHSSIGHESEQMEQLRRENAALKAELARQRETFESEVEQARRDAQRSSESKSDFLANISHEIRTPLNGVLGMLHALHKSQDPARDDGLLKTALNSGHLLADIINEVLEFSAIESREIELEHAEFDLLESIHEVLKKVALSAEHKLLTLKFHPDANIPRRIKSDSSRIKQLLHLLLSNAIKFTDKGEVSLQLALDDNQRLVFKIQDSGCGIPKDKLQNIFDAFEQVDGSHTRKFGGVGLGLAICQKIVNAFGAKLEVTSELGLGSTFSFSIPLEHPNNTSQFYTASVNPYNILYCDSNDSNREHAKEYFPQMGLNTLCYASISEIDPETLDKETPHLLILSSTRVNQKLDLECQLLKDLTANIKILLFTPQGITDTQLKNIDEHYFLPVIQPILFSELSNQNRAKEDAESSKKNTHILIVDDNSLNLQVIKELLDGQNFKMSFAMDGEEALTMIQKRHFDLVLMDIQMPKMDGLTCTRKVRALGGRFLELPIIAMTAHALKEDRVKSLSAGMDAHLTKPIIPEDLFACLNEQLGKAMISSNQQLLQGIPKVPNIEGFDLVEALQRLRGNWMTLRKLLLSFCEKNRAAYAQFENFISAENYESAKALAHQLKGSGANLGANALSSAAANIEKSIKDGLTPLSEGELSALQSSLESLNFAIPQLEAWGETETKSSLASKPVKSDAALNSQLTEISESLKSDIGKSQQLIESFSQDASGTAQEPLATEIASLFNAFQIQKIQATIETALAKGAL